MEWFFFFRDGKPQIVRMARSRLQAIEQLEVCWGTRWCEFEKEGFVCIHEDDVPQEVWEEVWTKKPVCPYEEEYKAKQAEYRKRINEILLKEHHVLSLRKKPVEEMHHRKNNKTMCDMHIVSEEIIIRRVVTCSDFSLEAATTGLQAWNISEEEKSELMKGFD